MAIGATRGKGPLLYRGGVCRVRGKMVTPGVPVAGVGGTWHCAGEEEEVR